MENQPARVQRPLPTTVGQVFTIEDFDNSVTQTDLGFNYFMGNTGPWESVQGATTRTFAKASHPSHGGSLQIAFNLTAQPERAVFAGYFLSLFGLTDTKMTLHGEPQEPGETTPFPGYFLDFLNLYNGARRWPDRSVEQLQFDVRLGLQPAPPLVVKIELTEEQHDPHDRREMPRRVYTRRVIASGAWHTTTLRLPNASDMGDFTEGDTASFNPRRVSLLAFIVEGDRNPDRGTFLVDNIRLIDTDGDYPDFEAMQAHGSLRPEYSEAFLDLVRHTSFLYFVDFASTDTRTGGMIQDRSTFADLLTIGGVGFQLTAYVIGAERGYLSRRDAAARVHRILRVLHDYPQGPGRVGNIGYKGWFYHLLGIDGLRKQNFDFTDSDVDESLNTVELSTIDTALVLAGVLTARQYFNGNHCTQDACEEPQIRAWADAIYARVDWTFMLEPESRQFYLGWKPHEARDDDSGRSGRFKIDDAEGLGQYASKRVSGKERPATLDFYTDEALLVALLAMAAPTPEHRVPASVFCAMQRQGTPFVKTFPGPLFTYQFGSVWLDTQALGRDHCPERSLNYFENTRRAILATQQYAVDNPAGHATLHPKRWGLSAAEGPFDGYFAEAAPPAALAPAGYCFPTGGLVALEAESGTGDGVVRPQREASGGQAVRLHTGEARTLPFVLHGTAKYAAVVSYRNDGPSDTVAVRLDGQPLGRFRTLNTHSSQGVPGAGRRAFIASRPLGSQVLAPGRHVLEITVDTDADGVEIDAVALEPLIAERPLEVGTVTVYGAASAIVHTPDKAVEALWEAYHQGMFHPRFGFGDAYNLDIANAVIPGCVDARERRVLRTSGPWRHFTGFAINHGPMLAMIDNYLADQFVPHLFMSYGTVRHALDRLFQR